MSKKAVTYLVVIFLVFAAALHYPFLAVANKPVLVSGIPVFLIYLMVVWLLLVAVGFVIIRKNRSEDNHGH